MTEAQDYGHFKEQEQNMFAKTAKFIVAAPEGYRGDDFMPHETAYERLEHVIGHEAIYKWHYVSRRRLRNAYKSCCVLIDGTNKKALAIAGAFSYS